MIRHFARTLNTSKTQPKPTSLIKLGRADLGEGVNTFRPVRLNSESGLDIALHSSPKAQRPMVSVVN